MSNNRGLVIIDLAMEYYVTIKNQDLEEYLLTWGNVHSIYLEKKQAYKCHAYYHTIIYLHIYV